MTLAEKKKKAVLIAVAYYIEQEKALANEQNGNKISWSRTGIEMIMSKRAVIQRRGRMLRSA